MTQPNEEKAGAESEPEVDTTESVASNDGYSDDYHEEYVDDYVVITGVSSGIGYATAEKLIKEGMHVVGTIRSQEDANRVQDDFGPSFTPLIMDVTDLDSVTAAAEKTASIVGDNGLTGLVNNAGIAVAGPLMHIPLEEMRRQFEVNVIGVMAVTQAFLSLLGAARDTVFPPGRIVNISSTSAHNVYPFIVPYAASKHALEALSDGLRRELMIYDIDVITIVAGAVATPIWNKMSDEEAARYDGTDFAAAGERARTTATSAGKEGMPVSRVSDTIYTALTTEKPKTSYVLSNNWLMGWFMPQRLPPRRMDRIIAHNLGLTPGDLQKSK